MSACQQFAHKVPDLEDLIRDDDRFEQLKTNYDIYKKIVFDIFDWAIKNRNTPQLKAKFNRSFFKVSTKVSCYSNKGTFDFRF